MNRISPRLMAALVAVSLAAGACGAPKGGPATAAASTTTTVKPGNTDASDYRVRLTGILQEHVYLVGIAVGNQVRGKDPAPALADVEKNTQRLVNQMSTVVLPASGTTVNAFADPWRKHTSLYLDYAKAKASGNKAASDAVKATFDAPRAQLAAFFDTVTNGNMPKTGADASLKAHFDSVLSAIDAEAQAKPTQFDQLKKASARIPDLADTIVSALVKWEPQVFKGNSGSGKALLRTELNTALLDHVYLTGLATSAALTNGPFNDASATLDKNSIDLGNLFGAVYGDEANQQFLALWRQHINFLVEYTKAKASNDPRAASAAASNLEAYLGNVGDFLDTLTKGDLTKQVVTTDLRPHITSMEAVIDAQSANDPAQVDKLVSAATHVSDLADDVTDALAKQFPDQFPDA